MSKRTLFAITLLAVGIHLWRRRQKALVENTIPLTGPIAVIGDDYSGKESFMAESIIPAFLNENPGGLVIFLVDSPSPYHTLLTRLRIETGVLAPGAVGKIANGLPDCPPVMFASIKEDCESVCAALHMMAAGKRHRKTLLVLERMPLDLCADGSLLIYEGRRRGVCVAAAVAPQMVSTGDCATLLKNAHVTCYLKGAEILDFPGSQKVMDFGEAVVCTQERCFAVTRQPQPATYI